MKSIYKNVLLTAMLILIASVAVADQHEMPQLKTSSALDKMKQLVGTWKGTGGDMGDGRVEVRYTLTSGGSAVVETILPGTSQEMTTIYYDEAGKLTMTHYCILGNHPTMELKNAADDQLIFDTSTKSQLKNQAHMNSLEIKFINSDAMEQKWSMVQPGKDGHISVFKLQRDNN